MIPWSLNPGLDLSPSSLGSCQVHRYLLLVSVVAGCNPFLSGKSGRAQPCGDDSDCIAGLVCQVGYCEKPVDVDCSLADCSGPGLDGQCKDKDLDRWGSCCDCDDENARVNPGSEEIPYNHVDDDCNNMTSDLDFDKDGYDDAARGGRDCDDMDPAIYPDAKELCNGVDDNCDGQTDEGFGVGDECDGKGECGQGVVECATPDSTVCSTMPGGSEDQSSEETCNQRDDDCDGETDEDAPFLLEAEDGDKSSDGIDNNCNGLVDEKGGVMVPVHQVDGAWIDAYETTVFEHQDCSGNRYGESPDDYPVGFPADGQNVTVTLYACSLPGIVPSGYMSRFRAQLACASQGKRLCTDEEYVNSCSSSVSLFPYDSIIFDPGTCNDCKGGVGHVVPTGSYGGCTARGDTFDMSGNLAEWIAKDGPDPGIGFVGGWSYSRYTCYYNESFDKQECSNLDFGADDADDIIKRLYSCPIQNEHYLMFYFDEAREDFGGRCCYSKN